MEMEFSHTEYVTVIVSNLMIFFTYFVDHRKLGVCKLVPFNSEETRR
jgi:hypothetical protein